KTWAESACEAAHLGEGPISSLAVSMTGKLLVSAASSVCLRDPATGKPRRKLDARGGAVYGIAVSPDGRRIVSHHGDLGLRMWDTDSGKELWRTMLLNPVHGMEPAFSPDGKTLAVGGCGQTLRLFEVETGKRLNPPTGHDTQPTALSLSPDGNW